MAKITPEEIGKMAEELKAFLLDWGLAKDVSLFYNGIRCIDEETTDGRIGWREGPGQPQDYCEYVAKDHILTMLYEGPLYLILNDDIGEEEEEIYTPEIVRNFPPQVRQKICERFPRAEYLWKYPQAYLEKICSEYSEDIARIKEALEFLEPSEYDDYADYLTEKERLEREMEEKLSEIAEMEEKMGITDSLRADEVLQLSGRDNGDYFWLDDAEDLLNELTDGGTEGLMHQIVRLAKEEFDRIFDKYHVWYDYGNKWNLTCFHDKDAECIYL